MRLLFEKIKLAFQKRTKITNNKKSYAAWKEKGYDNAPEVSVIIQSHNKSFQVMHILPKLRKYPSVEIIVIDDGSDLEHTNRLAKELKGGNEFLVRANDLYENVTYDRTIKMANGQFIALLQDDDDFDSLDWITDALSYFKQYPELAILGGKDGLDITFESEKHYAHGASYEHAGDFSFVPAVNRAPMWLNKKLYDEKIHHIDFLFAPFQFDDYEICARTWLCGLQVGWYDAAFKSLTVGGMRLWNSAFTVEQSARNGARLYDMYADKIDGIHNMIDEVNRKIKR